MKTTQRSYIMSESNKPSFSEKLKNMKVNRSAVVGTCMLLVAVIIVVSVAVATNRAKKNEVELPETTDSTTTKLPEETKPNTTETTEPETTVVTEPDTTVATDPETTTPEDTTTATPNENKSGCGSAVSMVTVGIMMLAFGAVAVCKKKKD